MFGMSNMSSWSLTGLRRAVDQHHSLSELDLGKKMHKLVPIGGVGLRYVKIWGELDLGCRFACSCPRHVTFRPLFRSQRGNYRLSHVGVAEGSGAAGAHAVLPEDCRAAGLQLDWLGWVPGAR